MSKYIFLETKYSTQEITRIFEFVWPTAVALWNMRWQINGFLEAVPNASYADVRARFVVGSDIHGADVRRMHEKISWEEQQIRFSEFILTNAFAVYEGWAQQILSRSGIAGFTGSTFWTLDNNGSWNVKRFISTVNAQESELMKVCFTPTYEKI